MKIKIVFKSGAIVDCEVDDLECGTYSGSFTELKWKRVNTGISLASLALSEVAAIFTVNE